MDQAPSIGEEAQRLLDEFELFDDQRGKVEYIIDLGKQLPPLPDADRTEANKIRGCQSQVWLAATVEPERVHLRADSDAILVKGLITLLLRLYDGRSPREILDNPPDVLEEIGLSRFLTPGRANGLYAMVGRIRQIAQALSSAAA